MDKKVIKVLWRTLFYRKSYSLQLQTWKLAQIIFSVNNKSLMLGTWHALARVSSANILVIVAPERSAGNILYIEVLN